MAGLPSNEQDQPRSLINVDGGTFDDELGDLRAALTVLSDEDRETYRDRNARDIARLTAPRTLIVAGPGSGKSFLFLARIKYWLDAHPDESIYVASFVRKLVDDLQAEVEHRAGLSPAQKSRVRVTTLHSLARSLIARSGGTAARPFATYVKVITPEWQKPVVWADVLQFHRDLSAATFRYENFAWQLETEEIDPDSDWQAVRATYSMLSGFYNAVGFPDMIVLAREAVDESPDLNEHRLWIVDEFQDFNTAEDHLIRSLTADVQGVLIAGDDEQALYQELKASLPEIIVSYYEGDVFANAMLPYCSRCSNHVCVAASGFMASHRLDDAIAKIYLPLKVDDNKPKVQVVATFAPTSAVDYIAKFLEDHQTELAEHTRRMDAGTETDPFLLILTPGGLGFYRPSADDQLQTLVAQYATPAFAHSADYRRLAGYCAVNWNPLDNFAIRKVLHYEGLSAEQVHPLIEAALEDDCPLAQALGVNYQHVRSTCDRVAGVVEDDSLTPSEQVAQLSELVSIADPEHLAGELDADPLRRYSTIAADEIQEEEIQTAGRMMPVELMSYFKSKGLSACHVIIIGFDDRNMDHVTELQFFVGLTRARVSLHLISSMRARGSRTANRFVRDLPAECCDFFVYRKTGRVLTPLPSRAAFERQFERWQQGVQSGQARRASKRP
jgi:hypothetical protein